MQVYIHSHDAFSVSRMLPQLSNWSRIKPWEYQSRFSSTNFWKGFSLPNTSKGVRSLEGPLLACWLLLGQVIEAYCAIGQTNRAAEQVAASNSGPRIGSQTSLGLVLRCSEAGERWRARDVGRQALGCDLTGKM